MISSGISPDDAHIRFHDLDTSQMPLLETTVSAWVHIEYDSTFERGAEHDAAHHRIEKGLMSDREHHVSRARAWDENSEAQVLVFEL